MSSKKEPKQPQRQKEIKYIEEPVQTVDGEVRIKKYVMIKLVGSGSYSKCHLVKNVDSDSTYVAKIIPKKKLEILEKQKLVYEIKIHQSLSHSNVVHLDHWFQDDSNQYIFMQYCQNGNLETKLTQAGGNMKQSQISRYGRQIVCAIQYIHTQNILHRDLKLCNFYLDKCNNVKLGDFGFACQLASQYDKKRETCGTPNYIAPEAISGFGYSFSSDVWAIGVILYRLKYGCCPFEGQTVKKTLQNVKLCLYKFPPKPKISNELKDLIEKILNINYDDRLTTQDILKHVFFTAEVEAQEKRISALKQEKRGFSFSRLFSLDRFKGQQKDKEKEKEKEKQKEKEREKKPSQEGENRSRQGIMQRESRNSSTLKKEQPKRSNSCDTFKQIKEIFKNKSKQNLANASSSGKKQPSPYYTMSTVVSTTTREKDQATKTNRASLTQYSYSMNLNLTIDMNQNNVGVKKEEQNRSNRLNQFIKNQINSAPLKEQLKLSRLTTKNTVNDTIKQTTDQQPKIAYKSSALSTNYIQSQKIQKSQNLLHQLLLSYRKKYLLPLQIQQQKDVTIIHYLSNTKQILYNNLSYLVHGPYKKVYKHNGEEIGQGEIPKVLKYVLENKIVVSRGMVRGEYGVEGGHQDQGDGDGESWDGDGGNLGEFLGSLPSYWVGSKEGVIFRYGGVGGNSLTVARLFNQEGFYITEENMQPIMYRVDADQVPRLLEGVVVMKIYGGWVKAYLKK